MGLSKILSSSQQALTTPPDSPTKGTATSQAIVKDLKHLFGVFLEKLLDLTNQEPPNTPVSLDQSPPGPDMVRLKELLVKLTRDECASVGPFVTTNPAQSGLADNEQKEVVQVADEIDLNRPICTTPDDYKSFEKWASASQFKTVVESWDKEACKYKIAEPTETSTDLDDYAGYVFVVRERVDRKSEEVMSYVDVKSEGLRDILREVLHGIKAVSLMEDKPSIEQNVLFHFLPELEKYAETMNNDPDRGSAQAKDLHLLIDHLKHTYTATSQRLDSMLQHGHITYDLLWALFKPGSHVYGKCFGTGEPRCVIFDAGEETTEDDVTYYRLECRYLDYDGQKFGEAGIFLGVTKFRGSKPIEALQAFPLHHHPDYDGVRKDLVKRGQKFRDLAGTHIQHCDGSAFFMKNGTAVEVKINGQVGVDAAFFRQMLPNYSRPRLQDNWPKKNDGIAVFDIHALFQRDREREKEGMQEGSIEVQQMGEDDFLISCPTVCCFSFHEKQFLECAVGALREVTWTSETFDCLKIPSKTKTVLSSLAKTRLGVVPAVPFDDVIDGKGRGLNILLHGPPGVGKTFTVEATSQHFNLPLYSISAGDLVVASADSTVLEQRLESIFQIAKHFDAVLLLDEADAFMEQRKSYHDTHNRLVTVFLRKLEYYQGILFLTTNRMIDFDEAILSRIHLIFKYEGLTTEFRREIWMNLLSRAHTAHGPPVVGEDELQQLDKFSLNGRDIKNLVSIAHALATVEEEPVTYKYLEIAAESNERFSEEFSRARCVESMYL
ncbi:hypothetical protein N7523_008382 [Penicillium sp. IBT 18751x]|nr:hypothetical protein N7523_008382 [Penicillium sp. IBT 18751x]